ncbi:hypothetical protein OG799_07110 [Micromonospora sp. NBC_00898]|uniref:hypothetical protein n=1 Tax=Micromonospora sp. NBC_00898 TaxID=2975981 RepID=UPI0038663EC1|nr:hypothetical protein OG799_07110 [Micromonospora sp. NBC_00898]
MSTNTEHGGADRSYPALLNPPRPAGRYRLLDHNSDPDRSLPTAHAEAPVNRPCDPYCQKGS